jgi:hypothetical protein
MDSKTVVINEVSRIMGEIARLNNLAQMVLTLPQYLDELEGYTAAYLYYEDDFEESIHLTAKGWVLRDQIEDDTPLSLCEAAEWLKCAYDMLHNERGYSMDFDYKEA